jgi:hypothetical protein
MNPLIAERLAAHEPAALEHTRRHVLMLQLLPGSPGKVLLHDGVLALLDVPEHRARVVRAGDGANPSCPVDVVPRHADRQVMVWQLDSAGREGAHVPILTDQSQAPVIFGVALSSLDPTSANSNVAAHVSN